MVVIIGDKFIPKTQIRCYDCKKVLEITKDDLNISNSSAGSTMPIIICPNCKCRIYISGEIANGLLK